MIQGAGAFIFQRCGDRKVGFVVPFERKSVKALLLKPFAGQHEKDEAGQGIKIPRSGLAQYIIGALKKEGKDAQRNGDIHVNLLHPNACPCRTEIVGGAIKKDGQCQREIEVTEIVGKLTILRRIQSKVFRKAKQHDIAKSKTSHTELVNQASVDGPGLSLFNISQLDGRAIADVVEQLDELP